MFQEEKIKRRKHSLSSVIGHCTCSFYQIILTGSALLKELCCFYSTNNTGGPIIWINLKQHEVMKKYWNFCLQILDQEYSQMTLLTQNIQLAYISQSGTIPWLTFITSFTQHSAHVQVKSVKFWSLDRMQKIKFENVFKFSTDIPATTFSNTLHCLVSPSQRCVPHTCACDAM